MKGSTVIQMYTALDTDAAASIDIPEDGMLIGTAWDIMPSGFAADGDGVRYELSFGSVSSFSSNDARQVVSGVIVSGDLAGTAANIMRTDVHRYDDFGDGIPVFGGERLYVHVGDIGNGVNLHCYCRLLFEFKGTGNPRRR